MNKLIYRVIIIFLLALMSGLFINKIKSCIKYEKLENKYNDLKKKGNNLIPIDTIFIKNKAPIYKYNDEKHTDIIQSTVSLSYVDSLKNDLKIKNINQIKRLEKINYSIKGELKKEKQKNDSLKKVYKNKNLMVTQTSDSTVNYSYKGSITTATIKERDNIFQKYKYYNVITSDDPDFIINGYQQYKEKLGVKKRVLNINANTEVLLNIDEINIVNLTSVEAELFPDNTVSYGIKTGYFLEKDKISKFIGAKIKIKILEF